MPGSLNPYVALSVAAALAHRQLAGKVQEYYDVEHYSEMLNTVALELARMAPVYVAEDESAAPSALSEADLDGATIRRGATELVLADGRAFRHISMLREDLRNAITTLQRSGSKAFERR